MTDSRLVLAVVSAFALMTVSVRPVSAVRLTTINSEKAVMFLKDSIHPTPRSASCPSGITAVKGGTFICNVVFADGVPGIVTVHMTNGSGGVSIGNADIRLADVVPSKADAFLIAKITPKPKSVTCPSGIKIVKGGTFDCNVVLADGAKAFVTVHMIDAIGDVSFSTKDIHLQQPASARPAGAPATVVTVIAGKPTEFSFVLSTKTVPLGTVTFKVTSAGQLPHSFEVCSTPLTPAAMQSLQTLPDVCAGTATPPVSPGGLVTLNVTFKTKGAYEYLCTLPGHASYGQKGVLTVT
jgi:uncharacterized cupredoxin-like copper-binding protein